MEELAAIGERESDVCLEGLRSDNPVDLFLAQPLWPEPLAWRLARCWWLAAELSLAIQDQLSHERGRTLEKLAQLFISQESRMGNCGCSLSVPCYDHAVYLSLGIGLDHLLGFAAVRLVSIEKVFL